MLKKDLLLAGALCGMLAGLVRLGANLILFYTKQVHILYPLLAASSHFPPGNLEHNTVAHILGFFVELSLSGLAGFILLAILTRYSTFESPYFKGAMIGCLLWFFIGGVMINLNWVKAKPVDPVWDSAELVMDIGYGMMYMLFLRRFSKQYGE